MVNTRLVTPAAVLLMFASTMAWAQLQPVVPPQGVLPPPPNPIITDPSQLTAVYQNMIGNWFSAVAPYAYDLFYALAGLELAVFGWNLWMNYHGDIRAALMMTANKILILGFFLSLLMNGQSWMGDIIDMFVSIGKQASGIPGLGPSTMLLQGFKIFGTLLWQATKTGLMLDFPTAISLILAALVICFAFLVITFQFIVTQVQTFLAIGMGYLFLGFGGSRWTTNYVERYFAFTVASGVKLMVLYMLAGAAWPLTNTWITRAQQSPFSAASVESCWVIMSGAILYAGIVWFASSQVSQLFGGSPNLSHSDFVTFMAPAIGAGVQAGLIAAGVVTAGATAVAGAAGAAAVGAGRAAGGVAGSAAGAAVRGASPSGATPSQPSAGGLTSAAGKAAASMAQTGASAIGRMPGGGSHGTPPQFNGFHH